MVVELMGYGYPIEYIYIYIYIYLYLYIYMITYQLVSVCTFYNDVVNGKIILRKQIYNLHK